MRFKLSLAVGVASVAALLLGSHVAYAATSTWNVGDGNWSDVGSWIGNVPDDSTADVVLPNVSGASSFSDVTVDGTYSVGTLSFTHTGSPGNYSLSCSGSGSLIIYNAISMATRNADITCPILLPGIVTLSGGNSGRVLSMGGDVSGSGGFTLNAAAGSRWRFTGTNTYSGTTTIESGDFEAGYDNAYSPNSDFVLADNADAVLKFAGPVPETIGSLSGGAASSVYLWGGTLTVGNSNDTTYAGSIIDGAGSGSSLVKQGSGKLTLTGTNTYTGPTVVNAGILDVNGSIADSSDVTVASGATLKGSGSLPAVTLNGVVAPGNSIGTINGSDFTFGNGSTLENEINAAGQTDLVNASSSVTINSGSTLKIIPAAGTYTPGQTYTIISAPSTTGTFSSVIDTSGLLNYQVKYYATHVDIVITAPAAVTSSTAAAPTTGFGTSANKPWLAEAVALISVATLATGLILRRSRT